MENNEFENEYNSQKPSGGTGKKVFFLLVLVVVLIACVSTAVIIFKGGDTDRSNTTNKTSNTNANTNAGASLELGEAKEYSEKGSGGVLTGVEIAEKVKPSVIAVVTYRGGNKYGEGSGIVMSSDESGTYIITCAHIISTSGVNVKIELEDETQYDAEIVGFDTRTDIGVLYINATGLTAAEFGDSSVLKVGEPVYAIGNPGGTAFYGSFTGGFISAIDRPTSTSESAYTLECIQHDAAINPGNSGGALVNSYGQVIGINSSKIAAEEYEGMGFAIPITVAKDIIDEIISNGYVTNRPKLGISYLTLSQSETYSAIARRNKLPSGSIIIAAIEDGGALSGTNVREGDIIIAANGKELKTSSVLLDIIDKGKVGDSIKLTIAHVNEDYSVEKFDVDVKLVEDKGSVAATTTSPEKETFSNPFAQ